MHEEVGREQERNQQLQCRSTTQADEIAEPAEQSMSALMDDKIHIVDEQSFAMLRSGIRHE
jgi:hypothetical protein